MSVKNEVLKKLESSKGEFFSGATLAEELGVSRAAVWKAITALKESGYKIDSITNRGYCLLPDSDIVSSQSIMTHLDGSNRSLDITVYKELTSTNTVLKDMATKGAGEGTVIVAESQTAGRGRLGRKFESPSDTGIYFSILLRPDMPATDSLFLTTSAAVAVAKSIESVKDCKAQIKWVNDVFVDGLKVCGILTEGAFNMETGKLDYAIVGIGINVIPPENGFPEELRDIAGAVFTREEDSINCRSILVAHILNHFMDYYRHLDQRTFFEEYRDRSILLGHKIFVVEKDKYIPATALDIDTDCHLIVQFEDGNTKELSSGEVSIRLTPDKN